MKGKEKTVEVKKVVVKGNRVELGLQRRNRILSRVARFFNYGYRIG
jgi:hypothetical protein